MLNYEALKTIGGALHYDLTRYGKKELAGRNYELFRSFLDIDDDSPSCTEIDGKGFIYTTKSLTLRYVITTTISSGLWN